MSKSTATVWFWSVVGLFAVIWVLLPTLLHTGYRGDVIEMQNIAPEWVWATKKHPALPSWILETLNILTCRSFAAPFIALQLCAILALWSVWQLGRTVLDERLALVGVFAVFPGTYFQGSLYNHNNVLVAFWCLSIYLVLRAFQTNQKRYWIIAGIALGLTFHAKYSAVFLVISILAYMLMRGEGRKYFRTPGPYLTTLAAFLVFLPQLFWLFYHDFAPLSYAADRPVLTQWYQQMLAPFSFAFRQLRHWIPALIILIPVIGFIWKWKVQHHHEKNKAKECEKFLFYCFMVPLICHMLYSGIKGVHLGLDYGGSFWVFVGLWLLLRFQAINNPAQYFRQAMALAMAIKLLAVVSFIAMACSGKQVQTVVYYPMHDLGAVCDRLWHSHSSGNAPYIAGDNGALIGFAAHAMSVRPSVLLPQGTWASDDDLNQKGGMIVWERDDDSKDMSEHLRRRFPTAEILPEKPDLPYKVGREIRTLKIGVAIVPPPQIP